MQSNSSLVAGMKPLLYASSKVGTSSLFNPIILLQAKSNLYGLFEASINPISLGLPAVGPFPSIPSYCINKT